MTSRNRAKNLVGRILRSQFVTSPSEVPVNAYLPFGKKVHLVDNLSTAAISGTSVIFKGGEERAYQGFDAELGWRISLFNSDAGQQLRIYGGGYRFTPDGGSGGAPDVQGPRARLDFTFDAVSYLWEGSRLSLGAEVQHDDPRGTQGFGSVRLRIALQSFGGATPSKLTAQERRMTDPIVRDIDIVSRAGAYGTQETATQTASGQAITVLSSASTTGVSLPGAVAAAGNNSTVILSGTFTTTATTTLQTGQTMQGGGTLSVRSPSGRTAMVSLPGATINSARFINGTVQMANNTVLTGFTINTSDTNVSAPSVVVPAGTSGATIANNTITSTTTGVANVAYGLLFSVGGGTSSTTVSGNSITATNSTAGGIAQSLTLNSSSNSIVSGNRLNAVSGGDLNSRVIYSANATIVTASSTGNVKVNGSCTDGGGNTGSISFTDATTCP
jgi:hypothetical protein